VQQRILLGVLRVHRTRFVQAVTKRMPWRATCNHACVARLLAATQAGEGFDAWKVILNAGSALGVAWAAVGGCGNAHPGIEHNGLITVTCITTSDPVTVCGAGTWEYVGRTKRGVPVWHRRNG
jgi:hypothetical protein